METTTQEVMVLHPRTGFPSSPKQKHNLEYSQNNAKEMQKKSPNKDSKKLNVLTIGNMNEEQLNDLIVQTRKQFNEVQSQ